MKNSVNQHSVLPVSFECIDGKRFRFHQNGPMTHLKKQFSKNFFFLKKVGPRKVGWGSHVFMFSLFMFSRTISNVSFEPANHFFIRCMHFDHVVHKVCPCNIQKGKQNWRSRQKVNEHWKYWMFSCFTFHVFTYNFQCIFWTCKPFFYPLHAFWSRGSWSMTM